MSNHLTVRELQEKDIEACVTLFKETIHSVNAKDYTQEQLNVWAPSSIKHTDHRWQTLLDNISYIAEIDHKIVGFADMTKTGYFDRLFVHKDHQREGIASALIKKLENDAKKLKIPEITVEASITAKPLFEKHGYIVIKQQQKEVQGINLNNFVMEKTL